MQGGGINKLKKMLFAVLADEMYSKRFSDYVNHQKNAFIELILFTSVYSMRTFAEHNKIDILLADDNMIDEISCMENVKKIILLSDGECVREQCQYPVIFKYQSAELILKEIYSTIADDDKIIPLTAACSTKESELIAVFSPFGGAGVSTYAKKMCSKFGHEHRTLYVNLEIFDSFAEFEKDTKRKREYIRGMSELIFYIKQKKDKLALKLESIVHENGEYSYILPVEDYRDLYSISTEDIELFINVLDKETAYEKVVFDVGYVSEASLRLLGMCDSVILPKPSNEIQLNKQYSFERLLVRNGMDKIKDNLKYVVMKRGE